MLTVRIQMLISFKVVAVAVCKLIPSVKQKGSFIICGRLPFYFFTPRIEKATSTNCV
jgi:hypothetical protein